MKIFGRKPSEIRKAIVAFTVPLVVLLIALPVAGLPAAVAAVVATVVSVATGASVYLSKPNVEAIIDNLDNVNPPVEVPPVLTK
jgi:hypothetical protein